MNNMVITQKGQELMAKMIAGTSTATFTKICTSDHDYAGETLETLQEMQGIKQQVPVSRVSKTDLTMVEVFAAVNNSELTEGYYVRGLGLYARDSQNHEILYSISIESANPDYMPKFGGKTVSGISYLLKTRVDNADQVNIELQPGATPTPEEVEEIRRDQAEHEKSKVGSEQGVHGLRYFENALQIQGESGEWQEIDTSDSEGQETLQSHIKDKTIHVTAEEKQAWNSKGGAVIQRTADLAASNWTGGSAPFVQTVSVEGVTAENAVSVGLSQNATDAQAQMYSACGVYGYAQASGQITFRARHEKPAANLPVTVFIFGQ